MESMTLLLFGATGDLAARKIFPALFRMYVNKQLPQPFSIIAVGRRKWSARQFQDHVAHALHMYGQDCTTQSQHMQPFLQMIDYFEMNLKDGRAYSELHHHVQRKEEELQISGNRLFYLSVAPEFFEGISVNLKKSGLCNSTGWKRLMIEKPFGRDLQSARELNQTLAETFLEEEIYRIDHYLGKPMVQNLESLEYANPMIQAIWNNEYIANVQITASETVGVEERAGYYDHTGAIRDMIQNHLLQLVMMTAMHLPRHMTPEEIRDEKRKVMEAIRPLRQEDVGQHVIRAQYETGYVDGQEVAAYRDEIGVAKGATTDTFVAARLFIDTPRWQGVPFYIRTGKRMKEKSTRIVVECKSPKQQDSQGDTLEPNLLVIRIFPDEGITWQVNQKSPGKDGKLEAVSLHYMPDPNKLPEAYELLLADAMKGNAAHFAHWREVELSWQWVEPIIQAFEQNAVPLHMYEAGSNGPKAADALLEQDGFQWWLDPVISEERTPMTIS
ncbi:glucose-6-phosphate dehydrogenase [Brevibacillus invocatus]|uniref:Glucose-6-phosphate 1-dehydrogenase n=1 Tax=Brevibacillus invocatus TaxID=173959 RepID=A0A3M8C992_9BACL|nr:glucose-6-phosphate dehydrogenase [Brevibacillus invocatus]RNB72276.1 glucose-6-phosphate dehydrogenase [Brevibacillus invocatus]